MQKNILSMILCRVPISFMEPWEPEEFLPLRVGVWIKVKQSFIFYNNVDIELILPQPLLRVLTIQSAL